MIVGVSVTITCEDGQVVESDHAGDVSMNGLWVATDHAPSVDTKCDVDIRIGHEGEDVLHVHARGHVARSTAGGVAVAITELLSPEGAEYMRLLMLYNANDTERVEREFSEHIGLKRRRKEGEQPVE